LDISAFDIDVISGFQNETFDILDLVSHLVDHRRSREFIIFGWKSTFM